MTAIRILSLLCLLAVSATSLVAQTEGTSSPGTQASPAAQPVPAPQSAPEKRSMSDQDMQSAVSDLNAKWEEYSSKGNWYLALYYLSAIGAAVAGALAGLVLQWDTPEKSKKKHASILAFAGAALVTVMTYLDFSANSRANKAAANQIMRLKIQVQRGAFKDRFDVDEKMQDIYEQKQILALPKTASATPTP